MHTLAGIDHHQCMTLGKHLRLHYRATDKITPPYRMRKVGNERGISRKTAVAYPIMEVLAYKILLTRDEVGGILFISSIYSDLIFATGRLSLAVWWLHE